MLAGLGRVAAAGFLFVLTNAGAARAQLLDQFGGLDIQGRGVEPGVTVLSRRRTDYDYRGIRVGSFMIRPELTGAAGYDDNVLGTGHRVGSPVIQTSASLQAQSNWSRNSLALSVLVDDSRYLDVPRQSYTDWSSSLEGSYDIGRDRVSLRYAHQNLNQTPRDLGVQQVDSSIAYRIDTFRATYDAVFNRLQLSPELGVGIYNFDDGRVAGAVYRQGFRDRTVVTPGVIARYELAPRRNLVAVLRNAIASYRAPLPGASLRDYNDSSALVGADYDSDGVWRARVLAGYEVRSFSNKAFKQIQAPVAEATLIYNPTGLTTITGTLARRIADSADETTTGLTETLVKLAVDHEYLRNVLLHVQGVITFDEYGKGQGSPTLYSTGVSVTWLVNRNARLAASYDLTARRSPASAAAGPAASGTPQASFGGSYTENRFLLRLSFGL